MATEKKATKKHVSKKAPKRATEAVVAQESVVEEKTVVEEVATAPVVEDVKKEEKKAPKKAAAKTSKTTKKATKKETKKEEEKKETKKASAKKTTKSTTKKVPKSVYVEHYGQQTKIDVEKYENEVKKIWLNDWSRLAKDLKEIDLYIKIEDRKVYFVVNGTEHGDFSI